MHGLHSFSGTWPELSFVYLGYKSFCSPTGGLDRVASILTSPQFYQNEKEGKKRLQYPKY